MAISVVAICEDIDEAIDANNPSVITELLLTGHRGISDQVTRLASQIDRFIGDEKALDSENTSYLRLTQLNRSDRFDQSQFDVSARFRLSLPLTEKKFRLVFENSPEEFTDDEEEIIEPNSEDLFEEGALLGVMVEKSVKQWVLSTNTGIRVNDSPDIFIRSLAERTWQISNGFAIENRDRVTWFMRDGFSLETRWDLEGILKSQQFWRLRTELDWSELEPFVRYREELTFYNRKQGDRGLLYRLTAVGDFEDQNRLNRLSNELLYRDNLYRQHVYMTFGPDIFWDRDNDFKPGWGISVEFEVYFGHRNQ